MMEEVLTLSDAMAMDQLSSLRLLEATKRFERLLKELDALGCRLYVEERFDGPHISVDHK